MSEKICEDESDTNCNRPVDTNPLILEGVLTNNSDTSDSNKEINNKTPKVSSSFHTGSVYQGKVYEILMSKLRYQKFPAINIVFVFLKYRE